MKVAVIAPTELPARRANTVQVMKMAQALALNGHSVRLAAPRAIQAQTAALRSAAVDWDTLARHYGLQQRFPVSWLPASPRLRRYDYSLRALSWAAGWGAEWIYTRLPQAAALSSMQGRPTIFEVHDLPQAGWGARLLELFLKGRGARRLVVITHALAADLAAAYGAPVDEPFTLVAPDGVDLQRYAGLPEPPDARRALALPGLPPDRFTAGYTGHLYPGRGADLLLELAARLPEMSFLVVGGEPVDVQRLSAAAAKRRLDNLLLTGFVPNADLPRYQSACDALLMPYAAQVAASSGGDIARYLSPMKLFEYLACGRVVLSSDLPVLQEVLNPGNALLLPGGDAPAWTAALRRTAGDAELRQRLAQQARQDAARYTWEARAARILPLKQ
ncbi:MAG: glycosyltransferase [Chloroflexota bacterium]